MPRPGPQEPAQLPWGAQTWGAPVWGRGHNTPGHGGDSLPHFLGGCCADGGGPAPLPPSPGLCCCPPNKTLWLCPPHPSSSLMFSAQMLGGGGVPSSTSSTNERIRSSTRGVTLGPEALVRWEDFMSGVVLANLPPLCNPAQCSIAAGQAGGSHTVGGTCGR